MLFLPNILQNRLKKEGMVLFSYHLSYPDCPNVPFLRQHYEKTVRLLQDSFEKEGIALGQRCLEQYLTQGKKRSRFAPPTYRLTYAVREEDKELFFVWNASMMWGKELLFSKEETESWDLSYPIPILKKRKKKRLFAK